MSKKEILIGTLGFSPQIITITLDLLRGQGHRIEEVISIYTDHDRVKQALTRLEEELQRMGGPPHRAVLAADGNSPVHDFLTEADAKALLRTLYREVKVYKEAGRRVHLTLAGGRRVMSAFVLVVAQLLFDEHDRAWSLFSEFWEKGQNPKMHLEPGDYAQLVPVPVLRWTPMMTMGADLAFSGDPWQVLERQHELEQREKDQRLRAFLRGLHPAQQEIARLLASGLDNHALAARRGKSINTITKQVSVIYQEWRNFFNTPPEAPVRDQIVADLSGYFARNGAEG